MNDHPKAKETAGTIQSTRSVTRYVLEYILCTAFEGGSNYWIDGRVEVADGQEMKADYHSECFAYYDQELDITHGNTEYDNGPEQTTRLTRQKLLNGIAHYLANGGRPGLLLVGQDDAADFGDADDADQVLQYALFENIIFG